jgi:hypothetical protein
MANYCRAVIKSPRGTALDSAHKGQSHFSWVSAQTLNIKRQSHFSWASALDSAHKGSVTSYFLEEDVPQSRFCSVHITGISMG